MGEGGFGKVDYVYRKDKKMRLIRKIFEDKKSYLNEKKGYDQINKKID